MPIPEHLHASGYAAGPQSSHCLRHRRRIALSVRPGIDRRSCTPRTHKSPKPLRSPSQKGTFP
jgi:hypothetical protein